MINQAREAFCQGRFRVSLNALIVSQSPAVPPTFLPLPSRNTSAGRPVVLDTALTCSVLPPSEKGNELEMHLDEAARVGYGFNLPESVAAPDAPGNVEEPVTAGQAVT